MREKLKSLQDESAWLGLRQMDTKELAVWDVTYLNQTRKRVQGTTSMLAAPSSPRAYRVTIQASRPYTDPHSTTRFVISTGMEHTR